MINNDYYRGIAFVTLLASSAFLTTACNHNDERRTYDIRITNLTANQPLSPIGIVLHNPGYQAWVDGTEASVALEELAEGGANAGLLADANSSSARLDTASAGGALVPGASIEFELTTIDGRQAHLTLFTMAINTNDAFTGVNAHDISSLDVGQMLSLNTPAWDSGTEENTEALGTMPGPADGGEGFNAARDDIINLVTFHAGVISQDDGLASSVLDNSHRFDNPMAQVSITRTK